MTKKQTSWLYGLLVATAWIVFENGALAQNDFLITAPNRNSVGRYDATTGESLGDFIGPSSGGLTTPGAVAVGLDGNVYVTSGGTNQVLRYDGFTGDFLDVFAEGNGLSTPNNIRFHGDYMYVGQFSNGTTGAVKRYNANSGAFVDDFLDVDFADGIEFSQDSVFVSNFFGGVNRFALNDGAFMGEFISAGDGGLSNPSALLLLDNGELLVSSYSTNSVKRYDSNGNFIADAITGLTQPEGLAIGPDGQLYAGSYSSGVVNKYDSQSFDFIEEFVDHGPVTNFFTFRTTAVPEPSMLLPLLSLFAIAGCTRRRPRV